MQNELISGIHNYCDRWCERCDFTARCRVAAMERELTDEERDINHDAFWQKLKDAFAEAKQALIENAEEHGIDLQNAISDEEFKEIKDREHEFIEGDELSALSDQYWKSAKKSLDASDEWVVFSPLDDHTRDEMLAILGWYLFFVPAKLRRGLHGLLDYDGTYLEGQLTDPQSDANGSIKVALIAVERSLMAWTALMSRENASVIRPHIEVLKTIKRKVDAKFPHAMEFVRPGFDELELVM